MTDKPQMTAIDHYVRAENLAAEARLLEVPHQREQARDLTALAQVHATLAVAGFVQTLLAVKIGEDVAAQIGAAFAVHADDN
ncbi:hypothetical protein SEA_KIKO_49 [Gordonia phage Kiko]|uniref:hypothetical protein n=1 Tax=Gordonia rubripertincta TaxID=36822 RepID=UPI000FDF9614|nr:hypothetical protein [Gordonia rubripertincta]AZV00772.1 hypothetical protein SEA_KIKO_49 [Gordonia phage Kiko]QMU22528.1 hypothetical protein H3V45_08695 [Gordonia rubripertincta]